MSGSDTGSSSSGASRPKNFYQSGEKLNDKNERDYNMARVMGLQGNYLTEHDIRNVFNQLDADKNGYLGAPDLIAVFKYMDEPVTDELIDAMLASVDRDGDGQIDFKEFRSLVKTMEKEMGGLRPPGYEPTRDVVVHDKGRGVASKDKMAAGARGGVQAGRKKGRKDSDSSGSSSTLSSLTSSAEDSP